MAMAIDPIPITLTVTVTVTATVTAAVDVVETPGSDAVKITGIVVGGVFGLALLGSAGSLLWMWMRRRVNYKYPDISVPMEPLPAPKNLTPQQWMEKVARR